MQVPQLWIEISVALAIVFLAIAILFYLNKRELNIKNEEKEMVIDAESSMANDG